MTTLDLESFITEYKQGLNQASLLVSSLSRDCTDVWDDFIEEIATINRHMSELLEKTEINIWVLYNDSTCASIQYKDGLQVDTEEWYSEDEELSKLWNCISENNEDDSEAIREALSDFSAELIKEVEKKIKALNISYDDLDKLSKEIA